MGVPKFFRWISERYPKINQRVAMVPNPETYNKHFDSGSIPEPVDQPDPMSTCGMKPPIDRLYIDMNGILHGCSHNNNDDEETNDDDGDAAVPISNEEIFRNVCYYLDRIVSDMVEPTELIYMAIDGVAPRAKLNQQRSRRYRSGKEGEIERTVYEAHQHAQQQQVQEMNYYSEEEANTSVGQEEVFMGDNVQEVEPGRFTGKFTTQDEDDNAKESVSSSSRQQQESTNYEYFHSNSITPGTPFFTECTAHLQHFVRHKLSTDPKWQHLTIIFSGPNVPGEGEHKIMDFMRNQKNLAAYNPNTRHCIMGQDGDLIMLGLVTHEPNLVLLREEVVFSLKRKERLQESLQDSLSRYIHNHAFNFLHLQVLRDYLAFEFETSNVVPNSPWDLEHVVDDFVFLTFFVGNDFLPHMPALDIADEAFDLLFYTYKQQRPQWLSKKKRGQTNNNAHPPYLTHAGNIVSGQRLEDFLSALGSHENIYYDNKKERADKLNDKWRRQDEQHNRESTIPSDEVLASKEEADRAEYREMLESTTPWSSKNNGFAPVVSQDLKTVFPKEYDSSSSFIPEENVVEQGLLTHLSNLLQYSASSDDKNSSEKKAVPVIQGSDEDLKGRYYFSKFGLTPFDAAKHTKLRQAYIEGLVWNLKYYYEGCVSWEWYYPYHYGPMLSDLVNIDEMLERVSFGDPGEPLRPYEQLMGCLPPSSAYLLPEPYQWLLKDESSPISDFYPRTFTVDMNGKRWPWEAVVLLPFIDSGRLIDAARTLVREDMLSKEERERNTRGKALVFSHDAQHVENVPGVGEGLNFGAIEECTAKAELLEATAWSKEPDDAAVFRPELSNGVVVAQPGFSTLQEAPIYSLWRRRIGLNVFGLKSRYATAVLEMTDHKPSFPPVSVLGPEFIGTTLFIGYPYLTEGFVTAVSDAEMTVRGREPARHWNTEEKQEWMLTKNAALRQSTHGEGLTGTGGWKVPSSEKTFSVRPLQRVETLPDGSSVKVFAKFEVEVPIDAALISPSRPDPRLANVPTLLEKDPFFLGAMKKDEKGSEILPPPPAKPGDLSSAATPVQEPHLPQPLNELKKLSSVLPPRDKELEKLPPMIDLREVTVGGDLQQVSNGIQPSPVLPPPLKASATAVSPLTTSRPVKESTPAVSTSTASRDVAALAARPFGSKVTVSTSGLPRAGGKRPRKVRSLNAQTRKHSTSHAQMPTGAMRSKVGSAPGRLLVVGAAAAMAFFANSTTASVLSPAAPRVYARMAPPLSNLRGGNQGSVNPFGIKQEMGSMAPPPLEFAHGTTTLSFIFQGGIIAAVDSRASIGNFVGSKTTQKVLPINDHMLGTMAGGAADCMFWIRRLKAEAKLHELTEGHRMSVARASRILSNDLYRNRGLSLSVGTMIMGFDHGGGPSIYYVDNTGIRISGDLFSVGSGSTFALGILDTERRYDMTEEEAIALGIKAIRHATFRDAFSGGFINVYLITRDGWVKVFSEDLAQAAEHQAKASEC